MNIISASALKEAFYMQFYLDYKNFLNINMGVERLSNGLLKAKTDIYSKTLYKYGVFDKEKKKLDMGVVREYLKEDKRISGSIEDFFAIIGEDNCALSYVASLMQYMKSATTAVEGGWLMVEDIVNRLLLKHFWQTRIEEGSMKADDTRTFTKMENGVKKPQPPVTYDNLFGKKTLPVAEYNVIELLKELPGIDERNKEFLFNHLDKSRTLRNIFTHQKLLPSNFADAVVIARYKLYSYMSAALCLRTREPVMATSLTVTNSAAKQIVNIRVWEVVNGKLGEEQVVKRSERGWECNLKRFHTYRFEVSGIEQTQEIHLDWFSLSPCGEFDGIKLTLLDNNFEQVAQNPGATMSEVVKLNKRIADTLANIDAALADATKAQKVQIDKVSENLVNIQRSVTEAAAAQVEASEEQRNELAKINDSLGRIVDMLAAMTTTLKSTIEESRDTVGALNKLTESVNVFVATLTPLLQTVENRLSEISEEQTKRQMNDKFWFTIKHLPLWLALVSAAIGLLLHIANIYTIYWMAWKPLYLWTLIGGPVALACYLFLVYATTQRNELITHRVKVVDWSTIGLSTLLWGTAIAVTPHPTDEDFIKKFNFQNPDEICQLFIRYVEEFIEENSNSEVARSKLAEYYLDISNEVDKALYVAKPMEDVKKYPEGCGITAEVFLRKGDSLKVKKIIEDFALYYPKKRHLGLERMHALLLINGNYEKPNPDKGLAMLFRLVEIDHYQKACYDLGHWSATDLAVWRPGIADVATLRYDLPTAVKYLRRVADIMPRAALELGCLYADLGIADSAQCYLQKAVSQSLGELRAEALFRMGLLLEKQGQSTNAPMEEALNMDYAPAVEHKALRTDDHRTAIEYMKRSGQYGGTRTIPPIVFEYLKASEVRNFMGLADSALKVLREQRPKCHFNRAFVSAMEAIIGTDRMKKNLDSAMILLRQSAAEGCLYAKMMCCYQDAVHELENGGRLINVGDLYDIEPLIPFAGVLLSDLLIRTGHYGDALKLAQYPIARNLPAAAMILSSIPVEYDIKSDFPAHFNTIQKELLYSYFLQKLVRLSPHKNRWLMECFNSDIAKRNYFRLSPDSSQISLFWQEIHKKTPLPLLSDSYFADNKEAAQLWVDVISASDNLQAKINAANWVVKDKSELCEKLVISSLRDLKCANKATEELWHMWLWCLGNCSDDFQMSLLNEGDEAFKKRYFDWTNLIVRGESPTMLQILPDIETLRFEKPILLIEQLDEMSGIIEEYTEVNRGRPSKAASRYL